MSNDNNTPDKKKKDPNEKPFNLPLWVIKKAIADKLSSQALAVYWWIYKKNNIARAIKKDNRVVYGKPHLNLLHDEFKKEMRINKNEDGRVDHSFDTLEKKGWIVRHNAPALNGVKQWGFLCPFLENDRLLLRAAQQELSLPDEEAVIEVESSVDNSNGVYIKFGIPCYDDADGNEIQLPKNVPHRPTRTAVWCNDPEGWYEPEDLPTHEIEY
jgi:hypothetical protein